MKATIDRTVPLMVERYVQRTLAPIAPEVVGGHVEGQLTEELTASDQSALGADLVSLAESVLARALRTLAMSGAASGDPRARPADRTLQGLPTGMEPILQSQVDEAPPKKDKPIYLPSTLRKARSLRGGVKIEDRQGRYNQRHDAGMNP